MEADVLEKIYLEKLDERIISKFSAEKNISYEKAMDLYYNSRLAEIIQRGEYDVQYLDYKILVDLLSEELS